MKTIKKKYRQSADVLPMFYEQKNRITACFADVADVFFTC